MKKLYRTAKTKRRLVGTVTAVIGILAMLLFFVHPYPHRFYEMPASGLCSTRLTGAVLDRSLALGKQFLLHNQQPAGNFTYAYDWITKTSLPGDSQVRQAGAMWALALIYQAQPTTTVGVAVEKALAFLARHSRTTPDGARYVIYPGTSAGRTGTVALSALAYIDYLRAAKSTLPPETFQRYRQHLDGYITFLVGARTPQGLWHSSYRHSNGQPHGSHSPYFDGESLLALVQAAKYMGRSDLQPFILAAADAGYRANVQEALQQHPDSKTTKGYYQWGSMAFFELATSGWPNTTTYGDYVLDLADWMIDVHRTLWTTRNTSYAHEGMIHAYQLAVQRSDAKRVKKFACVIDIGLEKLTSWQVGGPLANRFIRRHPTDDPLALGGVQNHRREAPLRIDVTQHQMHAVILARRYVYTSDE